jgi:hypothetical protein
VLAGRAVVLAGKGIKAGFTWRTRVVRRAH